MANRTLHSDQARVSFQVAKKKVRKISGGGRVEGEVLGAGEVLYAQPDGQPQEAGDAEYLGQVPGLDQAYQWRPFHWCAAGIEMLGEQAGERPENGTGGIGDAPGL